MRERIGQLLDVFTNHIIDRATGHLGLFFTEGWEPGSTIISYGHDIEAGWLLHAAAVTIACPEREKTLAGLLIGIATAVEAGLDMDGGLWYEKRGGNIIPEKHWWSQAEAMVGFLYAWKLNGDNRWWRRSIEAWAFVKRYIRQPDGREWYWGVSSEGVPMPGEDKAGFWKCPYHNTRACLEILNILADGGGSVRQDNH